MKKLMVVFAVTLLAIMANVAHGGHMSQNPVHKPKGTLFDHKGNLVHSIVRLSRCVEGIYYVITSKVGHVYTVRESKMFFRTETNPLTSKTGKHVGKIWFMNTGYEEYTVVFPRIEDITSGPGKIISSEIVGLSKCPK